MISITSLRENPLRRIPTIWAAAISNLLLILLVVQAITSLRLKSPTFDEVIYIANGYYMNQTKDLSLNSGHPIILQMLVTAPLMLMELTIPEHHQPFFEDGRYRERETWEYATSFFSQNRQEVDQMLFFARLMVVSISVVLATYVFRWSKELYGTMAGLFALFLYTFCPNILAHSRLATLDLGITAFTFIATYYYHKLVIKASSRYLLLAGFFLGLALLSKTSAVFLIPIYALYSILATKAEAQEWSIFANHLPKSRWRKLISLLFSFVGVLIVAGFVLNLGYGFQGTFRLVNSYGPGLADRLPLDDKLERLIGLIPVPIPASYAEVLRFQITHSMQGHPSFLMGMYSDKGWWYYYLVAFLIKVPLPIILLLIAYIFLVSKDKILGRFSLAEYSLVIPATSLFSAFSLTSVQIGFRYLLPILPFIYVLLSKLLTARFTQRKLLWLALTFLCGWYLLASLSIYPNYLAYFNELVGGPENGYKYLVDSNLDWGQDLKGLKKYMDDHHLNKIKLSYFGSVDPSLYAIKYDYLPSFGQRSSEPDGKWWYESGYHEVCGPVAGIIAISVTDLQGEVLNDHNCFQWLKAYEPVAKIGYSIFVYNIPFSPKVPP